MTDDPTNKATIKAAFISRQRQRRKRQVTGRRRIVPNESNSLYFGGNVQ